ncbi:hypothetical protein HMI54_011444 [Coelomomyces lativittatus]|nr:hypothetical protein HMI54_011444 [Coelomomyces lativittatus]
MRQLSPSTDLHLSTRSIQDYCKFEKLTLSRSGNLLPAASRPTTSVTLATSTPSLSRPMAPCAPPVVRTEPPCCGT